MSNDPYETRRPWAEWEAQRDALLDSLGFDDAWLERETEKRRIAEEDEA